MSMSIDPPPVDHYRMPRVCSRATDGRHRRGLGTLSQVLVGFPAELERRKAGIQATTTYPGGVSVQHDRAHGCYRVCFDHQRDDPDFQAIFAEHIKPLLIQRHSLEGGPEARFHYQPATRDWSMRYWHRKYDDNGREIVEDGKPKWVSCHRQVQAIAERVAAEAATILAEQLGPAAKPGRTP